MDKLSPMMQQYKQIKERHKDHLLFFRLGDFYELFFDDAILASKELELTLTGRDCGLEERAPMCGVPFHSVDTYIKRLVTKGYKVAICEQTENPAFAKGIVSREVIRVITPGTIAEGNMLEEGKNNYICSVYVEKKSFGISFADVSTGIAYTSEFRSSNLTADIINELQRFSPSEILFNEAFVDLKEVAHYLKTKMQCTGELLMEEEYSASQARELVQKQFGKTPQQAGLENSPLALRSLGALLGYIVETQKDGAKRIVNLTVYNDEQYLSIDLTARRNLELTETMRSGEKKGSLLWVLDRTKTSMGKRLMRKTIEQPLIGPAKILKRQAAVGELISQPVVRGEIISLLSNVYDLERLMTKVIYGSVSPRELKALSFTAQHLPQLKEQLALLGAPLLAELNGKMADMTELHNLIENAVIDEPPINLKEGGVIKPGFNEELDELRGIRDNGKDYILKLEEREKERTGIKKLKISYNRVFGYYIEVTKSFLDQVPEHYIRKQTLANCERFITDELKQYEHKVLMANERIVGLEQEIFEELRRYVAEQLHYIQQTAGAVAAVDVLCSFAEVAVDNNYVCPEIATGGELVIKEGRHPVVETVLDSPFVPNDTLLDVGANRMAIITGPNMAGKSTYMRQVALIVLMAQIGSFVPAKYARIALVDKIFTRVGASDDLSAGQSTFMVEMSEVAHILKHATKNSLVILDEIGRGTSTFDGMSIAKAVVEYMVQTRQLGCKTLFATHYHELTVLEKQLEGVVNYNIVVKKRGDDITFLRKIVRGGADDSYGIAVAKLAGIPDQVVGRANEILAELESGKPQIQPQDSMSSESTLQISFDDNSSEQALEKIRKTDPNTLSPIEALNVLYELKTLVK